MINLQLMREGFGLGTYRLFREWELRQTIEQVERRYGSLWITASGCPKGQLTIDDFIRITLDSCKEEVNLASTQSNPQRQPSAETIIHAVIYRLFPKAQDCYHPSKLARILFGEGNECIVCALLL